MKGLTKRELQVVRLVCEGLTHREIADILEISINTVGSHLRDVKHKIQARTKSQMIAMIVQKYGYAQPYGVPQGKENKNG